MQDWRFLNPAIVAQGNWPMADALVTPATGILCPCSFLPPLDCEALKATQVYTSQLQGSDARCLMPECVFLAVTAVEAAGGAWGPMEITPLLASLLVLRSGWQSMAALLDTSVLWLAFRHRFIGSGHQVSVQTSATVRADSVNSTARVKPYCIS